CGPVAGLPPRGGIQQGFDRAPYKALDVSPSRDREQKKKSRGRRNVAPDRVIDRGQSGFGIEPDGNQNAARSSKADGDVAVDTVDAVEASCQANAGVRRIDRRSQTLGQLARQSVV